MVGLGKKLILVIFVFGLLTAKVFAAEPMLSGDYVFSLTVTPPSRAVILPLVFQAKIIPSKLNEGGTITVIRSSVSDLDGFSLGTVGAVYDFIKTKKGLSIFLPVKNRGMPLVSASITDCHSGGAESNDSLRLDVDVYFTNLDSKKIARQAVIYGGIEDTLPNFLPCGSLTGTVVESLPNQNQKVTIEVSGILIKQ
ncbi:MAG: hypothetical protein WCL34_11615 [Methylococcaceae bacterium]